MNRRAFLKTIAVTAGVVVLPWDFEDAEELRWAAFKQRLLKIAERGHDISKFVLFREEGGFRYCVLPIEDHPPLTWYQPWGKDVDVNLLERENRIYDLAGCSVCGQRTLQQHRQWCKRASSLFDME
jgi:hypothetical protein